ncbi:hypothetical protein DNL40_14580 [Xylanimonas oleitrophica]|uniref:Uncharacterized protein n=1 Tax=Xylanimonas oleitrophica TaxID=2607479 RepID=A0A2W5WVI9_9MICO|nr:hypothetical protein [Xylanimonas oleitrophica]PZR51835.1 hypothetical protein DNL40_14580 [Xylanimonas oleitrophica]
MTFERSTRLAYALVLAGAVLAVSLWWNAGSGDVVPRPAATVLAAVTTAGLVAAAVLVLAGLVALGAAVGAGWREVGARALLLPLGLVVAVAGAPALVLVPLGGLVVAVVVLALTAAAARRARAAREDGAGQGEHGGEPDAGAGRLAVVLLAGLATAVTVAQALHAVVWDPRARVPGSSSAQVREALGTAYEAGSWAVLAWAALSLGAVLAYLLLGVVPAVRRRVLGGAPVRPRALVVAGLALVALVGWTGWWAAFPLAGVVAEAVGAAAGPASPAGPAAMVVAAACGAAAFLVVGLAPGAAPRVVRGR